MQATFSECTHLHYISYTKYKKKEKQGHEFAFPLRMAFTEGGCRCMFSPFICSRVSIIIIKSVMPTFFLLNKQVGQSTKVVLCFIYRYNLYWRQSLTWLALAVNFSQSTVPWEDNLSWWITKIRLVYRHTSQRFSPQLSLGSALSYAHCPGLYKKVS